MPQSRQKQLSLSTQLPTLEARSQGVVGLIRDFKEGEALPFHHHRRAQLVYARSGVMHVSTRTAVYVVPPQRAVWMPGQIEHSIYARNAVEMRTLYIEPETAPTTLTDVTILNITPLLRELILTAVQEGSDYKPNSPQARLMSVIIDQLANSSPMSLSLPMPTEPRLRRAAELIIANPSDNQSLKSIAKEIGASERTLSRLFTAHTQMSFQSWRQQCHLLHALELLANGETVTNTALEVGYENTSAFIAMFKRCLGTTPNQYVKSNTLQT